MATVLAAAEALRWLGGQRADLAPVRAAGRIDTAVRSVVRKGDTLTYDLVGPERASSLTAVTEAIVEELARTWAC
jgi:3-isopropylmalate dehydrogenase